MRRVLVVSPHPDDEAIGCGGTLREHVVGGDQVRAIFLTSGEQGGHGRGVQETAVVREREAATAASVLGLSGIEFWHQPDGRLRAGRQLVERLRATLEACSPNFLYVTHDREMHDDHRAAARLVRRALAVAQLANGVPQVRMFEVWTPLQIIDEIIDITPHMEKKLSAIRSYESQCAVLPFDQAFRGLARYRGELHSWPGGAYAEVFARMRL